MSEYYAVHRSGDSLAHYGIKGMRWGVRKAIQSGNDKALSKQFKKAQKKLAKLEKRGNSGKKYTSRAVKLAAASAAAGGLAVAGTKGVAKGLKAAGSAIGRAGHKHLGVGTGARRVAGSVNTGLTNAGKAVEKWGNSKTHLNFITRNGGKEHYVLNNGPAARIAAGAAGLGLAGAAGYNAYRAATAKRNRKKAAAFRSEMNKAFAGTKYANGSPTQTPKKTKKRRAGARA